jgi:cytochrome c-type biogenesis protein
MDEFGVSLLGALAAGFLSFVSPCVLPIVPASLCFLGGTTFDRLAGDSVPPDLTRRVVVAAIVFVIGFATVFVALGATASALGRLVSDYKEPLAQAAGIVIVLFGLHFLGVFRIGTLNFERRFHVQNPVRGKVGGLAAAYVAGLAFAFGWTPCVGPVLAAILTIAAGGPSAGHGVALLGAYAAGIGAPFIAAASAVGPFLRWAKGFRRHLRAVEIATGVLLIATGGVIFFGQMAHLAQWFLDAFPALGRLG